MIRSMVKTSDAVSPTTRPIIELRLMRVWDFVVGGGCAEGMAIISSGRPSSNLAWETEKLLYS